MKFLVMIVIDLQAQRNQAVANKLSDAENMIEEEAEFNRMLDDLGPRFVEWWRARLLLVDADLLPQNVPGYKPPLRLLPTGMRSRLTNVEMTRLRKLARKLPCHFAFGVLIF